MCLKAWSLADNPSPPYTHFELGGDWAYVEEVGYRRLVLWVAYSRALIPASTLPPVPPKVINQPQISATLDRNTPIPMPYFLHSDGKEQHPPPHTHTKKHFVF